MAFQGIDVRQTGDRLIFRNLQLDSTGTAIGTGSSVLLRIYELQNDGTLKSYDFNSNTFKTTALTTETATMVACTGNNSTFNTALYTYSLTTLTGFTAGNIYLAHVTSFNSSPFIQTREFQFGVSSAFDPFNGTSGGLTALPNVVIGSAGGLISTGTGSNQLTTISGGCVVALMAANSFGAGVYQTDAIDANSLKADAATEIATATWSSGTRTLTASTNLGYPTNFASLLIDSAGRIFSGNNRIYYVDPSSGNDSNAGTTQTTAFLTSAHAISVASAGDTIEWLGLETLSDTLTVNKSLILQGLNWDCGVTFPAIAGGSVVSLTADSIIMRKMRVNDTGLGVGVLCNGVNDVWLYNCYITGQSDGLFSDLINPGRRLRIDGCRFTSAWDGAVLGRWVTGYVRNTDFYTDGSYPNLGTPLPSYHGCTGGAGGSTLMNIEFSNNSIEVVVNSGSNVNNSTTVSGLTMGERTLCHGDGNTIIMTASKSLWAGTMAGVDANADDTNGTPTIVMGDGYRIKVTKSAGTPTLYDCWSRNLGAGTTRGIIELGQGQTTDGTSSQFSDLTGAYIRSIMQPSIPLRKLDVSAGGEAGLDWANIGSPTTSNTLSATTISNSQIAASVTAGVTVTTNNDKTGYTITPTEELTIAYKVWEELLNGTNHTGTGMAGQVLEAAATTVGLAAVAAQLLQVQTTGTDTNTKVSNLATTLQASGTSYQFTSTALANAPTGTGSSGTGSTNIDPARYDKENEWRFESEDQLTAVNQIRQIVGFEGLLAMDFSVPLPNDDTLSSALISVVSPSSGITVANSSNLNLTPGRRKVLISLTNTTVAGTYIVVVQGTTIDSQVFLRRGILVLESLTGT